jgi:hypothetical protein
LFADAVSLDVQQKPASIVARDNHFRLRVKQVFSNTTERCIQHSLAAVVFDDFATQIAEMTACIAQPYMHTTHVV